MSLSQDSLSPDDPVAVGRAGARWNVTPNGLPAGDGRVGSKHMNVLIVEDDVAYAKVLGITLERASVDARSAHAQSLAQACEWVRDRDYDVVLLDLGLPDSSGLATVRQLQDANDNVPIVILSGRDDAELAKEAVQLGAEDYIVKGEQNREGIVRALEYAVVRHRNAGQLRYLATHDALTGLANRAYFLHELEQLIAAAEQADQSVGVFSIDLDRFRSVNELVGYRCGDQLLHDSAGRLDETLKRGDVAARIDADQFAVVVGAVSDEYAAERVAERIHAAFAAPVSMRGNDLSITVSIGVALYPVDGDKAETLLAAADMAMHEAKEHGRNRTHFHNAELAGRLRRRREVRTALDAAVRHREFEIRYQPRFERRSRVIHSIAAAPFWHRPAGDAVGPDAYYADAEREGLLERIEEFFIESLAGQISDWAAGYEGLRYFSMPLSRKFLQMPDLAGYFENILLDRAIAPSQLEIVIPESALVEARDQTATAVYRLHDLGLRIAVGCDAASTASLRQISRLPLDALTLTSDLVTAQSQPGLIAVSKALILFAHGCGLSVTADGIDSEETFSQLCEMRCDVLQGSYLMQALTVDELEQLLVLERHPTHFGDS